jgi:hypothetical protein
MDERSAASCSMQTWLTQITPTILQHLLKPAVTCFGIEGNRSFEMRNSALLIPRRHIHATLRVHSASMDRTGLDTKEAENDEPRFQPVRGSACFRSWNTR